MTSPTNSPAELLGRFSPFIQYDSMESYSADSVATMTACSTAQNPRGNVLRHAGHELAAVGPPPGEAQLELSFLRPGHYQDDAHTRVLEEDFLDVVGKEYIAEAHAMHLRPGMADQIYGHATADSRGSLWLQYWFFYYFNDKAMLWMGLHEGDWEMIQLRIGTNGEPDEATYAQHTYGERCVWGDVETEDGAPVVYSARGSHASYLRRGIHRTDVPTERDYNDAGGPRVRPHLNPIADGDPSWVAWPGRWGSTREQGEVFGKPIGSDSPPGPRRHAAWRDPLAFHEEARDAQELSAAVGTDTARPAGPNVAVRRERDHAVVSFTFPAREPEAPQLTRILISLDGAKDGRPPVTKPFPTSATQGEIEFPLELEDRPYTIRVRGVAEDGVTGRVTAVELPAP